MTPERYNELRARAFGIARGLSGPNMTEDLIAEALAAVWKKGDIPDNHVYLTMKAAMIDYLRKWSHSRPNKPARFITTSMQGENLPEELFGQEELGYREIEDEDAARSRREYLTFLLSRRQRDAALHESSIDEIAKKHGRPKGTIASDRHHVRKRLLADPIWMNDL